LVIFYSQGLNAILFNKNVDSKTYISLVPTSAHTGDGMGDLMALIVKLCQTKLAQRLSYSEELQCTVLEVCLIFIFIQECLSMKIHCCQLGYFNLLNMSN
jgi:translation initiation factor IF-2